MHFAIPLHTINTGNNKTRKHISKKSKYSFYLFQEDYSSHKQGEHVCKCECEVRRNTVFEHSKEHPERPKSERG